MLRVIWDILRSPKLSGLKIYVRLVSWVALSLILGTAFYFARGGEGGMAVLGGLFFNFLAVICVLYAVFRLASSAEKGL